MADIAMCLKKDGTTYVVNAQAALEFDDSVKFFCIGEDLDGNECGCPMSLRPKPLNDGGHSWHFMGHHIAKCNAASKTKEVIKTKEKLNKVGFDELISHVEADPREGNGEPGRKGRSPKRKGGMKEEFDIAIEYKERDIAPVSPKKIYALLVNSSPDEVIDGIEVRSLRCDEWALSRGLCKKIEGVKLVICERCLVPQNIARQDNEIVLRICGTEDELSSYIVLKVEKEFVRKKIWNVLRCDNTKKSETKDKFVVLGKFESIEENLSRCVILHSRMVERL